MSIQSLWQPATVEEPAEFDLDYVNVKVQAAKNPAGDEIQVRLATAFNTDWMERKFNEWYSDMDGNTDEALEALYPMLKELRELRGGNERAIIDAAINELEQRNSGLIRA